MTLMTNLDAYTKLCRLMPGGVNSPVRAFKGLGVTPMVVASAKNEYLYDVEGNSFIDYCCSWGAIIHGHAHPEILESIRQQLEKGTTYGVTSEIEGLLAEKVIGLMSSIEKIRLVSSGTEATMTAARLARGFTKRELIVKFNGNYHGHADFFLVKAGSGVTGLNSTSSSKGIPESVVQQVISLPYNNIEITRQFLRENKVAAVIVEPIAGNMGVVPATQEFLQMLREETTQQQALLIFDEVITGFRVALKGAQSLYGIIPDLTCLGKILGGGMPLAALGGRAEIMDKLAPLGDVYQAGTLSGNPVSVAAGLKTLALLEQPQFYEDLEYKVRLLTDPLVEIIKNKKIEACLQRVGSMFTLFLGKTAIRTSDDTEALDFERYAAFFRYMYANGVYIPPSPYEAWFISAAHTSKNLTLTKELILNYFS